MISREDVLHVARLARLALTETELETLREQLNAILAHIDALKAVDTRGIEPTSHAVPQFNVMRDDEPPPCVPVQEMPANAPDRAAWTLPLVGATVAVVVLGFAAWRWRRRGDTPAEPLDPELDARVDEALARYDA